MNFKDKVVIITGAGGGIGLETSILFAEKGAKVIMTDINEEAGNNSLNKVKEIDKDAVFMKHDISDKNQWKKVVKLAKDKFGKIDVLFNNAGVFLIKSLIESSEEDIDKLYNINIKGTFLGMKYVIPVMKEQQGGSIINTSSTAGLMGSNNVSLYGMTKSAIRNLSKHASWEYAGDNIRVNSIYPGFIDTDMLKQRDRQGDSTSDEQAKGVPLKRLGTPMEIAKSVLYLSSDYASYITGEELIIDGGRSVGLRI